MGEIGMGPLVLTSGTGAPRGDGYAAGEVFGVRVAGIPVERLAALRFRRTWARVDETVRLAGRVAAEGERLADALHAIIGREPSGSERPDGLRPALVALRRDLFAGRRPRPRVWTPRVAGFLPEPLAERVSAWLGDLDRLARTRAGIADLLDRELAEKTAALRDAARLFEFRQGLAQSSPDLSERLNAWLAAPADAAPGRQTSLRLAKYLARATAKTSPYATFTASGLGRWSAADAPAHTRDPRLTGVAEADRYVVHSLWKWAARQPGARDHVVLRVNPSAFEDDGRLWFLGHRPAEPINSLPVSEPLRAVLDLIRSNPGITHRAVARRLGSGGDLLLGTLLDSGLVERCPPYSDQDADALPKLIAWLTHALPDPGGEPARLLGSLRAIDEIVAAYPRCAPEQRRGWRSDVDRLAKRLRFARSGPAHLLPAPRLVHESYVLPGTVASWPGAALRRAYDDLDRIRRFLALLDPHLPLKIALADHFLQSYGPAASVPFLTFYRRIHEMGPQAETAADRAVRRFLPVVRSPAGPGDAGDRYGPRVARLAELRRTAWRVLHAAQEQAGTGNPLPPATLDELMASWPRFIPPATSISVYAQVMNAPEGPRLVVNSVSAGPYRGVGRIRHLLAVAGQADGAADRDPAGGGWALSGAGRGDGAAGRDAVGGERVLAEFRAEGGSNLDLRPRMARVIDYPFTGGGGAEPGIATAELLVEYDEDRGLLVLRGPDGSPVRPLHLGLTSEMFLPPAQSLLVRGFGTSPTVMMPGWAMRGGLRPPPDSSVEYAPRLTIGAVVLARARWRMRAGQFPVPGKGEDRGEYLIRLARWLDEYGIPREFFARSMDARDTEESKGLLKSRKPTYVDVTDWFLLQDFARTVVDSDRLVVLEEVLPPLRDAPRYGEHGSRVTEYVFELTATEDGGNGGGRPAHAAALRSER